MSYKCSASANNNKTPLNEAADKTDIRAVALAFTRNPHTGSEHFLSLRECIMKKNVLARFSRYQRGATAIEYGLIVGLIALGIVTGATALGDGLSQGFTQLSTKVTTLFGVKSGS